MAISQLDKIVIVVAVLVAASVLIPVVWINSLPWSTVEVSPLWITNVQFDEDYLNIIVENTFTEAKIISQVTVRDLKPLGYSFSVDWTSAPHVVAVHEPVPVGEEISFSIRFDWASGRAYQIQLEIEDREDWIAAAYNAVAP
jgi:hypothetical protein